ncbi:MAG: hypothetical protein NVS2B16_05770 [Chloroflexota bacterium]
MDTLVVLLLVVAGIHFLIAAIFLPLVFRDDIRQWRAERRLNAEQTREPACMYCGSKWTHALDEGQTRWDNGDLVLVTTFECDHCHLPFWHVERVHTTVIRR